MLIHKYRHNEIDRGWKQSKALQKTEPKKEKKKKIKPAQAMCKQKVTSTNTYECVLCVHDP